MTTAATSTISSNRDFAIAVLQDGGWPVTSTNISNILQWMASENSPTTWTGTAGANNPLNNGYGSGGGAGLGSYPSLEAAAQAVADNLNAGNYGYPAITAALSQSAPAAVFEQAVIQSSWAAGHYGWGSAWHTALVPIVSAADSIANGATSLGARSSAASSSRSNGTVVTRSGNGNPGPPASKGGGGSNWTNILGAAFAWLPSMLTGKSVGAPVITAAEATAKAQVTTLGLAGHVLHDLTDTAWWKRAGLFVLGTGVAVTGLVVLISTSDTGKRVEGMAATAALA